MDKFANDLMDKADNSNVKIEEGAEPQPEIGLTSRLEVFKEVARWVAIKNRLGDDGDAGAGLDDLKRRLRNSEAAPRRGTSRAPPKWGDPLYAADVRRAQLHPSGDGGAALDAIKQRIPEPDVGDDDGAGDGA